MLGERGMCRDQYTCWAEASGMNGYLISSQQKQWYIGTALSVLSATCGDLNAVYEVLYEGEDEAYEIDNLISDSKSGSVQYYDV